MSRKNIGKYQYHFTNCSSLFGMLKDFSVENRHLTMWATHSSFMNDSTEYEFGKEKCKEVLRLYEDKTKVPACKSIFRNGEDSLDNYIAKDAPFLISLSGNIESAAMWSMYSSNGSGIALKFDVATLQRHSLLSAIDPTNCIYCKKASSILKQHEDYVSLIHGAISHCIGNEDDVIPRILLLDFASQIKHSSFRYEDEHRIVVPQGDNKVQFRVRDNIIIPYIEVKVPIEALKGIVIGPTANYDYTKKSIEMFIENLNKRYVSNLQPVDYMVSNSYPLSIDIKMSEVPYRG